MASLIETLINVLDKENSEYEILVEYGLEKTGIILRNDVDALAEMVEKEQLVVNRIAMLEKERVEASEDIANVLNRDVKTLTLPKLISLMAGQPKERDELAKVHDKLSSTMSRMVELNERNSALLNEAMEALKFEMNIVESLRRGPETNNYGKGASYEGTYSLPHGSFDSKS